MPIYVHVVKGEDEAKIQIEPDVELVYNHGLSCFLERRKILYTNLKANHNSIVVIILIIYFSHV